MGYDDDIKRLGGIVRVTGDALAPLTPSHLEALEQQWGHRLPDDYAAFLRTFGGGVAFTGQVSVEPLQQTPEYLHRKASGIPNYLFEGGAVGTFFGADDRLPQHLTFAWALGNYAGRLPDHALPIASDGAGNLVLLIARPNHPLAVYWWDHENEWDAGDYHDDTGAAFPEAAKFQNVYLVGESFSDFLENLSVA